MISVVEEEWSLVHFHLVHEDLLVREEPHSHAHVKDRCPKHHLERLLVDLSLKHGRLLV